MAQKPADISGLAMTLGPRHDIYHSGYLVSAAAASGASFDVDSRVVPHIPLLRVKGMTCAVDLHDSSSTYDLPTLEACRVYFKRSYLASTPPPVHAPKVRPFGLNYSCRTARSLWLVLNLRLHSGFTPERLRDYLLSPRPRDFEAPPSGPPDLRILFNTRLWPPDALGPNDDPEKINGLRVDLVRGLRRAFGPRFVGGLIPDPHTLREFPDLVTPIPHRRAAYARVSRGPAIGIYSRGVHGSNAFKIAEYLASAKCIVGESLAHTLPEPLAESHCVAERVEDVLAACDRLLTDMRRLDEIRRHSWDYYRRNIRFDRRIARLMEDL